MGPVAAASSFLEHLAAAIRIPTVSHTDRGLIDYHQFERLRDFLQATYPRVHRHMEPEIIGESLLYTWNESGTTEPILLMAHQDVVPAEPGAGWGHPPFAGVCDGDHLWGRGAFDDKGSLIAILEAAENLLGRGFQPRCTIHLAFGHDEEVGGSDGAAAIAATLAERGVHLDFVLDEGGAVTIDMLPMVEGPLALIGIGEKGSLDVELKVTAAGGHSSLPPPSTAIGTLAEATRRVEANPMPARLDRQRHLLHGLAGIVSPPHSMVLRHHRLFAAGLKRRFGSDPRTNALIHTTAAVTTVAGGVKPNLLPTEARAVVNYRIMPGDTSESVLAHVRSVVGRGVEVGIVEGGFDAEPPPLSDPASASYELIANTIGATFAGTPSVPWILMGATDSRHFHHLAGGVYRFAPFTLGVADMAGIHGAGERIRTDDAAAAVVFYERLMTAAGS